MSRFTYSHSLGIHFSEYEFPSFEVVIHVQQSTVRRMGTYLYSHMVTANDHRTLKTGDELTSMISKFPLN